MNRNLHNFSKDKISGLFKVSIGMQMNGDEREKADSKTNIVEIEIQMFNEK